MRWGWVGGYKHGNEVKHKTSHSCNMQNRKDKCYGTLAGIFSGQNGYKIGTERKMHWAESRFNTLPAIRIRGLSASENSLFTLFRVSHG